MPATIENYKQHLQSKSYKRAQENNYNIDEYADILVEHRSDSQYLYCKITGLKVIKKKSAIEKHVKGKRFRHGLKQSNFLFYFSELNEGVIRRWIIIRLC